jgi:hypothetical protein
LGGIYSKLLGRNIAISEIEDEQLETFKLSGTHVPWAEEIPSDIRIKFGVNDASNGIKLSQTSINIKEDYDRFVQFMATYIDYGDPSKYTAKGVDLVVLFSRVINRQVDQRHEFPKLMARYMDEHPTSNIIKTRGYEGVLYKGITIKGVKNVKAREPGLSEKRFMSLSVLPPLTMMQPITNIPSSSLTSPIAIQQSPSIANVSPQTIISPPLPTMINGVIEQTPIPTYSGIYPRI